MKKNYKYLLFIFLSAAGFLSSQAQESLQLKLGYGFSTPVGSSFKNLISNTSFRGFNGELAYPVNDQLLIGLDVYHSDFYQKYPRQVYGTKNGDISAVLSNSVQITPVLAKVTYSFLKQGFFRPYAGLGAGIDFIQFSQYLGEYPSSKSAGKAAVQADAGVNIPFSRINAIGLNLGANFNYLPFNYSDIKNLNNWGVHAGFYFSLR